MASYSTNLKNWGATGSAHPDGYNYLEGEQPVDAWDNWLTDNLIKDIKDHLIPLTNRRLEPFVANTDPAEQFTESTSPKSWNFSGSDTRDIHEQIDVTLTNSSAASVTEDVTVELYDGSDTLGTLKQSEIQSVTVASGATKTVAFLVNRSKLDNGTYHIEITTSGTTLAVDSATEYTRGGEYTLDDDVTGDLELVNQFGVTAFSVDAVDEDIDLGTRLDANGQVVTDSSGPLTLSGTTEVTGGGLTVSGNLTAESDLVDAAGNVVYDQTNNWVNQTSLENDSVTVTAGNQLTGGGAVALGGSVTINLDEGATSGLDADLLDGVQLANIDWVDVAMAQSDVAVSDLGVADVNFDLGTNDLVAGTTTVFDTSVGEVPRPQIDDERIVHSETASGTNGSYLTSGEEVILVDTATNATGFTVTLSSADVAAGNFVTVLDIGGGANSYPITVDTENTETIDGVSSTVIEADYGAMVVASDGTNWFSAGGGSGGGAVFRAEDGVFSGKTLESSNTMTVATDESFVVSDSYTVDGTLTVDGSMTVM